jgi:glycosyltransferase involved in cell wall biosynthesis
VISFVIPSMRARRADLLQCLAALARETAGVASEALVVVEDESAADGLAALSTKDLAVRPVLMQGGAARRRNAAFKTLAGDVVALLDDDAEPSPGYGAALVARFADGADRVVQGAVWPAFDAAPAAELAPVLFSIGGFNRHGAARREDVFISANCAFTRGVLERVGPMREDMGPGSGGVPWGDDTEWHGRATRLGVPTQFDDAVAVRHRIQAERIAVDAVLARAERVGRTRARIEWDGRRPGALAVLRQRALAAWAKTKGDDVAARCLARRLGGYADELSRIRAAT